MIITLKNANFSNSNIGTLSTWRITRSIGKGATYNGVTSVNKGDAFSATITIAEGYELGTSGVLVTMGGIVLNNVTTIIGNTITISIGSVTNNVVINVPTISIGLSIDGTIEGTEICITDNTDSSIKNIKMYGKSKTAEGTVNLIDTSNFAWAGSAGYLSATGVWTPTVGQGGDLPRFATTQMKIPVIAGHVYSFANLPVVIGGRSGIHWFNASYTGIDTSNTTTAQSSWISRDVDKELSSGTFTAPANAAYCELQFTDMVTPSNQPAATEGLIASLNNSNTTLYDYSLIKNLINVNNFAWVNQPGFISSTGIWTLPTSSQNIFAMTQMKIPVIGGAGYTFQNLPCMSDKNVIGIHWFDSSYTGIDPNNTSTAQASWIGRDCQAGRNSATIIAPENAAYCELQITDTTAQMVNETTYKPATTEGLIASLINANTLLYGSRVTELGIIYINTTKNTASAQSVDLSDVLIGAETDYIHKKEDIWYVNISGTDTALRSELQEELNNLRLSTSADNYVWGSNGNILSVTYSK